MTERHNGAVTFNELDAILNGFPEDDGLIFACRLDGEGSAELLRWKALRNWKDSTRWHLMPSISASN